MIKKILAILAALIGVVIVLWSVVIWFIFTPETITPHIVGAIQQYTKSEVSIKSVDISLFTRFPNITLKIDSLRITQTKDSIDDLLFARQCRVAVNPFEIIKNKNIAINHVSLRDANIYLYVDSLNGPLKTFILPEAKESREADTLNNVGLNGYKLTLRRLKIDSTQLVIDDRRNEFYTRVENFNTDISMDLSSTTSHLEVVTGFSNLIVWQRGNLLVKRTAMELRSQMVYERELRELSFERARLRINDIDLRAKGFIRRDTLSNGAYVDIRSTLNTPSIAEFLALIPSSVIDKKDKITTQGSVQFDLDAKGVYSASSYPTIGATLKIDNAKAKYESRKLELERVDCDAYAFVDLNTPSNSYADIRSFHVNTSDIIDLTLSGKMTNILEDAAVDLNMISDINFNRFTEIFPLNDGVICKGTNSSDIDATFKLSDIQNSNYANLYIDGESKFKDLDITVDAAKLLRDSTNLASLYVKAESGVMLFGDQVVAETNSRTLRAKINFQNLNYRAKSGEYLLIKDVDLIAGANFDLDKSKVNGVGIRGVAKNTTVSADSLIDATLESADITIIVKPKNEVRNSVVTTTVTSKQVSIKEPNFDSEVSLSAVDMSVALERDKTTKEINIDADISSKKISIKEPNYNSNLDLSAVDIKLEAVRLERKTKSLSGVLDFSDFKILTDVYPMDVTIHKTSISIHENSIYLDNANLTIGESKIVASGRISNLLHRLYKDPRASVNGELSIYAPKLDLGALVEASNHSVLMTEEQEEEEEQPTAEEIEKGDEQPSTMFLVPPKIEFVLDLNIDKALFWGSIVENFESRATINKGVLSLDKIELNAIGAEATGAMTYRNVGRKESNIDGHLSLKGVDINRIGELLPSVHTMLPMLESFEGVVDFDVKANTNIDSNSEVDISTLYSAMRFKGRNLVLMDSETFADMSKKMMFKNKERNLVDSLEVFALVAESTVDVLPFSISIDRYTAILGGSQVIDPETLALDCDYHISILKSPLPFKAGVDVKGDLEDFKIKITKAKLKKTDFDKQREIYEEYCNSLDARASDIEEQRAKLREQRNKHRKQHEEEKKEAEKSEKEPQDSSATEQ